MATQIAYSEVMLCNFALDRIGSTNSIQSLDTTSDQSVEAARCAVWYPQSRDAILVAFPWPWAQQFVSLTQVNTVSPATPEYMFSYRYPASCLDIVKLVPTPTYTPNSTTIPQTTGTFGSGPQQYNQWWLRPEGDANPWPFRINADSIGRLVVTDLNPATALITTQVTDCSQYSADFASLLVWRLAIDLAYAIAVSDERRKYAESEFQKASKLTRARMLNESQSDIQYRRPNSDLVRRRFS